MIHFILSILLFIGLLFYSKREHFIVATYLPCARPKVLVSYTDLNYVKCIGINENPSDDERNEFKSRLMNIPFYHIRKTFSDLDAVSTFVSNEMVQLNLIKKRFPIGPCYILIGRNSSGMDTWILFPNFLKIKQSVPNFYTLILYHQWTHMLINHPFYAAPYECGIPTTPIRSNYGSKYPTPLSHCPNMNVTSKAALYSGQIDNYNGFYCNYYTDFFFQPCGCANCGVTYPNVEIPSNLLNNYIYAMYVPNGSQPMFSAYSMTGLNRSGIINGQEITTREYTWIVSENGQSRLELNINGMYIYKNNTLIWSFPITLDPRVSQIVFEGTTLKLMLAGRTVWQKNFLKGSVSGTSPYVLQLSDDAEFLLIDAKGNIFT